MDQAHGSDARGGRAGEARRSRARGNLVVERSVADRVADGAVQARDGVVAARRGVAVDDDRRRDRGARGLQPATPGLGARHLTETICPHTQSQRGLSPAR